MFDLAITVVQERHSDIKSASSVWKLLFFFHSYIRDSETLERFDVLILGPTPPNRVKMLKVFMIREYFH